MLFIDNEMLPVNRQKLEFKGCRAYTKLLLCFLVSVNFSFAQQGSYSAQLHRADGNKIAFTFDWKTENGQNVWYIKNGSEKIRVDNFTSAGDSFFVEMPVFESHFRFVFSNKKISGVWIKKGSLRTQQLAFTASPGKHRFIPGGTASRNITGRWSVEFSNGKKTTESVAEFRQKGSVLTGTFLSSTGDYRFLEGIVKKDSLYLSGFDGSHAVLFRAKIDNGNTLSGGWFYSGAIATEQWKATRDDSASLSNESVAMYVKPGHESLNFAFPDINGQMVSINSERFRNKVTIVQLMGSWCPNCMDETAFLSDFYNKNKERGVEVVALAYEYSNDWERSVNSLKKFQRRFNVQYPILNTMVTVSDTLRTEKTLPQVTRIKFFPSSIIIDKKGKIRKLDTGFNGPATGEHYVAYKEEFINTINRLLKEQ